MNIKTSLLYRGSEHGWTANDFYSRAVNQGASILLIKVKDGPCVGGFTLANWRLTEHPIIVSDSSAMIFNLTYFMLYPAIIQ
jgi:hypothetical protein